MKGLVRIGVRVHTSISETNMPASRVSRKHFGLVTKSCGHQRACITSLHAPRWQRTRGFAVPASTSLKVDGKEKERVVILGSGWAGEYLSTLF